jgi:putative transposase
MPNHIHLLLKPNVDNFSACMHLIQMSYAKKYCWKYHFIGHVWQGRFRSSLIENDAYLLACGNYIEMNPVRAGLTHLPEYWEWSSHRFYAFGEANDIIDADPLYKSFGDSETSRRVFYRQTLQMTRGVA